MIIHKILYQDVEAFADFVQTKENLRHHHLVYLTKEVF